MLLIELVESKSVNLVLKRCNCCEKITKITNCRCDKVEILGTIRGMTHSYATRAWAMHHMSNNYFGLQAIARSACVNPRTIQTWFRQETHRAKPTQKQPREYERAMGIILLDLLPHRDGQIAKLVFTNARTLREWRIENRYRPYESDLTLRTLEGVTILQPLVKEVLEKFGQENFLADKMLWPDPNLIYENTWKELDELFHQDLIQQQNVSLRSRKILKSGSSHKIKRRVFVGPHFTRYTEITRGGQHFPLESYQLERPTKHLIGAGGLEAQRLAKISDQLLPYDWKIRGKVVTLEGTTKAKTSRKVYEPTSKEKSTSQKMGDVD